MVLQSGTAYFDIEKDSLHPFEITCNNTSITVLGTEFEVKREGNHIKVLVNEGKVRFTTPSGVSVLTKGMTADYNETTKGLNTNTSIQSNSTSYATGKFNFNGTSLRQVIMQLKTYDSNLEIEVSPAIENVKLPPHLILKKALKIY